MPSGKNDSFMSSFPNCIPFIFLPCLSALARIYSTMLKRSGERGHPCPVPDLSGKALSFTSLNTILAVGHADSLYQVGKVCFYS